MQFNLFFTPSAHDALRQLTRGQAHDPLAPLRHSIQHCTRNSKLHMHMDGKTRAKGCRRVPWTPQARAALHEEAGASPSLDMVADFCSFPGSSGGNSLGQPVHDLTMPHTGTQPIQNFSTTPSHFARSALHTTYPTMYFILYV